MKSYEFDEQDDQTVYSVSELNNDVKLLLEDTFTSVFVEGEISNFIVPNSGHWYFSLKDANAQVRCAMFRGSQRKLGFTPKDGSHVLIKARVSLYESRGDYQLIAESMEERGEGKLQRQFEALKKKLAAAGLFDTEHKKVLPLFPNQIGVITSSTGAAVRDILNVLKRRYPCAPIILYPTLVQGTSAAQKIAFAIELANHRNECDVIILARGGGSLEDLWPFNEEIVAHAIYKSKIPIISGIGHEIDFTIADFVADKRAPTPSAAAEIATPDKTELLQQLTHSSRQITRQMQRQSNTMKQQLRFTQKHLYQQHPKRQLIEKAQRLDFYELTLVQLQTRLLNRLQSTRSELDSKLHRLTPIHAIRAAENQATLHQQSLLNSVLTTLHAKETQLANAAATLNAISPLATLTRGYAIATTKAARVIHDTHQVNVGDEIEVRLRQGTLGCVVEKID
ncbi:MAG: exodeoxyribonuclease VII large subunit [Gammaproteobacteria bacterium RIFCSPHIGHO2_12_FULL_43_28]|nr:MAG: exodeoxyribonuclease VII large subunit [Gammaproteobacteria bacterium RIFCSPHIGHO2_12_FULL_43_28]